MCLKTILSKYFMINDISALGRLSLRQVRAFFFGTGTLMEHTGTKASCKDICSSHLVSSKQFCRAEEASSVHTWTGLVVGFVLQIRGLLESSQLWSDMASRGLLRPCKPLGCSNKLDTICYCLWCEKCMTFHNFGSTAFQFHMIEVSSHNQSSLWADVHLPADQYSARLELARSGM